MIKESYLVPGRVLGHLTRREKITMNSMTGIGYREFESVWIPCMVISYIPVITRRHSRAEAPRNGWDVLVFWLDARRVQLESVRIWPNGRGWGDNNWKLLW